MSYSMPVPPGNGSQYHLYAPDVANDGNCTWCGGTEPQHYIP